MLAGGAYVPESPWLKAIRHDRKNGGTDVGEFRFDAHGANVLRLGEISGIEAINLMLDSKIDQTGSRL